MNYDEMRGKLVFGVLEMIAPLQRHKFKLSRFRSVICDFLEMIEPLEETIDFDLLRTESLYKFLLYMDKHDITFYYNRSQKRYSHNDAFTSLTKSIDAAGGSFSYKELDGMGAMELLAHLCTNGIRFHLRG